MDDKDSDFGFEIVTTKGTFEVRMRWWTFCGILAVCALLLGKCAGVI
jgi:hypothetical protein